MTVIRSNRILAGKPPKDLVAEAEVTARALRDYSGDVPCATWEQRYPQFHGWDDTALIAKLLRQLREMRA